MPKTDTLRAFPWATLGRRETSVELFKKHGEQEQRLSLLAKTPLLSVVIPIVENVPHHAFRQCIEALKLQSYPHWEVLVVGGSENAALQAVLSQVGDGRMLWVSAKTRTTAVARKNLGAKKARGEWLGFLAPEDVLSPVAFFLTVLSLQSDSSCDLIYGNEAAIDREGSRILAFLSKPEFSWFNLIHFNYIGQFWMVRRSLFSELGDFDSRAEEHHEQDFLLRLSERTEAWRLLPFFLCYRRGGILAPAASSTSKRVVEDHFQRKNWSADVALKGERLDIRPFFPNPASSLISIVICFRDRADWTVRCLEALSKHLGKIPVEVVLVNNQSSAEAVSKVKLAAERFPGSASIVDYDGPFNFAEMHNRAVRENCRGDFLFLLNNDVFLDGDWSLDEMAAWARFDWVGTVGICLRYSHGAIQHGGIRARFGGGARLARVGHADDEDRLSSESHEVFANTFAVSLLKRKTFDAIGGLRGQDLANGFGDVAFNFECLRRGMKNLYMGHLEGTHLESASRGMEYEYWEEFLIERQYPDILQKMLREDLGYNRTPGADYSVPAFLRQALVYQLRNNAPWLDPLKPPVKKLLRSLRLRGESKREPAERDENG